MRGIGEKKLEKLFVVIDRARNAMGWEGADGFTNVEKQEGASKTSC